MRLLLCLLALSLSLSATQYYVSNTGSDSNNGTSTSTPWQTIAHVNAQTFSAGDSVLFQRGGMWRETLSVPSSGTSGNPITFGAYGTGALPVFNGSNQITSFTADGGTSTQTVSYTMSENDGGTTNFGWRLILPANTFSNNGSTFQVVLAAPTTQAVTITGFSIGKQAPTGNLYDQDATNRVQITFGGSTGVTIPAGATVTSDSVTYAMSAANIYVAAYGTQNGYRSEGFHTGNSYVKSNGQGDYNTAVAPSGYSALTVVSSIASMSITYSATGLSNVWNASVTTQPNLVFSDNVRGALKTSKASLAADGDWYWASNVLSLYSATNPNSRTIEAAARTSAVNSNSKNYLTFDSLHATKTNGSYSGSGFALLTTPIGVTVSNSQSDYNYGGGLAIAGNSADSETVQNSTFAFNGQYGIVVLNDWATNQIYSGNAIHDNGAYRSDDYYAGIDELNISGSIDHNTIQNNGSAGSPDHVHGIYHNAGIPSSTLAIHDNVISGQLKGAGISAKSSATIYNNLIYGNADDGISSGFNTTNNISLNIYGNVLHDNVTGISVKSIGTGTVSATIEQNTLYNNGASAEFFNDAALTSLVFENNLIYAGASGSVGSIATQTAATIKNNIWYSAAGFSMTYGGASKTWSAWQTLGFDTSGLDSDPQLNSPGSLDFSLKSTSPARNAGTPISGYPFPYGAPDLGALPYYAKSANTLAF